ncbi:MAG TPA: glycosyl hydrolase family 18 protein [Bacteroidota bacterium]|nr:glycosyl hydrolase family 18 protein [Bacteroidota bacterium]
MTKSWKSGAIALILLLSAQSLSAQLKWVTGYYPDWYYAILKPGVRWNGDNTGATGTAEVSLLNYSYLTHIVVFSGLGTSSTSPYCSYITSASDSGNLVNGSLTGAPAPYLRTLIDSAHVKGVKVVISMGGIYGTGQQQMSSIAASLAKTDTFTTACVNFAKRHNADGVEINWEFPYAADRVGAQRLFSSFRRKLDAWSPKGLLVVTVYARDDESATGGDGSFFGYTRDSLLADADQINLETYTMWQGNDQDYRTGFNTPIDLPTQFPNYNGYSLNDMAKGDGMGSIGTWQVAHYPPARLGMSLSPNTSVFTGASTMGQKYTSYTFGSYADVPSTNRYWDSLAQSPWYSDGASKVITYEDTTSIRLKIQWAINKGFGGVMLYELGSMFLPSAPAGQKDQLLRSAYYAAGIGTTGVTERLSDIPQSFDLKQNYPNPFNPSTTINYSVPVSGHVKLSVYNLLGVEVRSLVDEMQAPGAYRVVFRADDLASGVYFYRLQSDYVVKSMKMVLLK